MMEVFFLKIQNGRIVYPPVFALINNYYPDNNEISLSRKQFKEIKSDYSIIDNGTVFNNAPSDDYSYCVKLSEDIAVYEKPWFNVRFEQIQDGGVIYKSGYCPIISHNIDDNTICLDKRIASSFLSKISPHEIGKIEGTNKKNEILLVLAKNVRVRKDEFQNVALEKTVNGVTERLAEYAVINFNERMICLHYYGAISVINSSTIKYEFCSILDSDDVWLILPSDITVVGLNIINP